MSNRLCRTLCMKLCFRWINWTKWLRLKEWGVRSKTGCLLPELSQLSHEDEGSPFTCTCQPSRTGSRGSQGTSEPRLAVRSSCLAIASILRRNFMPTNLRRCNYCCFHSHHHPKTLATNTSVPTFSLSCAVFFFISSVSFSFPSGRRT